MKHIHSPALTLTLVAAILAIPTSAARFTFDPSRGLVEVRGKVNGYLEGRFGIDTGADGFYLDAEFARKAGLEISAPNAERQVVGVDGYSELRHATLRSLSIGDERMYNVFADIIDLRSLSNSRVAPPDGLIGRSLLSQFYVTVDYPNRRLDLFTHEPQLKEEDHIIIPFDRKSEMINVSVSINEKPPLTLLLDYCASTSVITPAALERIGLDAQAGSRQTADVLRLGEISAENVSFFVRDLPQESFQSRNVDGILGYSFLYRYALTIDYGRGLLFFRR